MNLGQVIDRLMQLPPNDVVFYEGPVEGTVPGKLASWRGIYAELALEHLPDVDPGSERSVAHLRDYRNRTVRTLLAECENAVGKTFEGYKGGDFVMSRDTRIWIDNHGEYSLIGLKCITHDPGAHTVLLVVEDVSDYHF